MFKRLSIILFVLLCTISSYATHNRAGEITYKQLSALQYEFTLTTFTDVSQPGNADRPSATLNFGDGTSQERPRTERLILQGTFIQRNKYVFTHTFPGYSTYIISYQDPNRNNSVQNMINSINTAFYVETELVINPFIGFNNSPILLLEPIDFGGLNKLFVHNPNAYDVDGDSLSFKLVPCKQDVGLDVFGFQYPDVANGFASKSFEIDAATGQLIWENPIKIGLYNIAIMVEEWRYISNTKKFQRIGYVVRDMQIEIVFTNNRPPVIRPLRDTCIIAGSSLNQNIFASDSDGTAITLTATGGPFEIGSPDTVIFPQPNTGSGTVSQTFTWTSSCNSVRKQPYQVVFKAVDNGNPKLVDLEDWQIRIISPAPENLQAVALGNGINLSWDKLSCGRAIGYRIYRKSGSNPFVPEVCETGLSSDKGYSLIGTINNIDELTFRDNNNGAGLNIGNNYCYRIVGFFADGAESIVSAEACASLSRDLPAITNVSILKTDLNSGKDSIVFAKPTELDTNQYLPPYTINWKRFSSNNSSAQIIKTNTYNTFAEINDTSYVEQNINTKEEQFTYTIELIANGTLIGNSKNASSIFLSSSSAENRQVNLLWNVNVPWTIDSTVVYRLNKFNNQFDSIGISFDNTFLDTALIDGVEYCYYVKTIGRYSSGGFKEPLINLSQEYCAEPKDTNKPCAPLLAVDSTCTDFTNELTWTINSECTGDVVKYKIYKSNFEGSEFELLTEINSRDIFAYNDVDLFTSRAGCYFISSVDSFNNESSRSNIVCVDNCPQLNLPNVFTPNGDNKNDLFEPKNGENKFIDKVTITIYNRYGREVYQTNNTKIQWDGKDQNSGEDLPEGVYFYTIEFSEIRVKGLSPKIKTGYIHLIR